MILTDLFYHHLATNRKLIVPVRKAGNSHKRPGAVLMDSPAGASEKQQNQPGAHCADLLRGRSRLRAADIKDIVCGGDEHEDERDHIQDFGDGVREEKDGPIQVIAHIDQFCSREQRECHTEIFGIHAIGTVRKDRADDEKDDVNQEKERGRECVHETSEWHRNNPL